MPVEEPIDLWMVFEVVAAQEDAAVESLENHVEKLGSLDQVDITSKEFDDVKAVENPHPSIDEGYSLVSEVECTVDSFPALVEIVMNYGPTMIEVKGPDRIELELGEAQDALNMVAEMMHKFQQAGVGGMMISRDGE
ncbi:MAG: hypothetical protein SVU32_09470 [Candidatus Nanohaloarchaea archaeon]|nr:hypothetical protein [Candidatus Nanohaloarchaea archaeon]